MIHSKKLFNSSLYLFLIVKSSQPLEVNQQTSTSETYYPTSPSIDSISLPHMFANFFSSEVLKLPSNTSYILPILHLTFNHVTFQPISQSSRLFLEKNSLNSNLSHPTLSVISIPFLHLFLNNVYLYFSPL